MTPQPLDVEPSRTGGRFKLIFLLVKTLAILVGLLVSTLCLMSLINGLTSNLLVQAGLSILVVLLGPVFAVRWIFGDRLPRARGLMSDALAVTWLGLGTAFIGLGGDVSGGLLGREAVRLTSSGEISLIKLGDLSRWLVAAKEPEHPLRIENEDGPPSPPTIATPPDAGAPDAVPELAPHATKSALGPRRKH